MSNDYRTLDEVKDDFNVQTKKMIGASDKIHFPRNSQGLMKAHKTRQFVLHQMLKYAGIDFDALAKTMDDNLKAKVWNDQMAAQDVEIRHMNKFKDEEIWMNGLYVFKRKEFIGFLSDIIDYNPNVHTLRLEEGIYVFTNWKYRSAKMQKIFVPGADLVKKLGDLKKGEPTMEPPQQMSKLKKDMQRRKDKKFKRNLKKAGGK